MKLTFPKGVSGPLHMKRIKCCVIYVSIYSSPVERIVRSFFIKTRTPERTKEIKAYLEALVS